MQTAEQNVPEYNRIFPSELDGSLGRSRHYVALGVVEIACVALHEVIAACVQMWPLNCTSLP